MQRTRKPWVPVLSPDDFSLDHPFVRWLAAYHKRNAARSEGQDIYMGELAAKRFSIGIGDDNVPVLGVAEDDIDAFNSIKWTQAAFLRRVNGRDWIALSCKDARIEGAKAAEPVLIRMWLPTTTGLLNPWLTLPKPTALNITEAFIRNGKPHPKGEIIAVLPLTLKGSWQAPAQAATAKPAAGAAIQDKSAAPKPLPVPTERPITAQA